MKRLSLCVIVLLTVFSCTKQKNDENSSFDGFKDRFLEAYWGMYPAAASGVGFHQNDNQLPAYNSEFRQRENFFVNRYLDSLLQFKPERLNALNRLDHELILNTLQSIRFNADTFKSWQWDPSGYNIAGAFADIVNARNLDSMEKIPLIISRLKQVETYYKAAKENIIEPTKVHTELAIEQTEGAIAYLKTDLNEFISHVQNKNPENDELLSKAIAVLESFKTFLVGIVTTKNRDFRIGKSLYERKFYYDIQSSYSAEEIYGKALIRKQELQAEIFTITQSLWKKYFDKEMPKDTINAIKMMIDEVSQKHVHRDSLMQEIERQIPELSIFVKEHHLLYLDPAKPLRVRHTPAYMDGVAGASINAPGPYDKNAETYYNVSTLEKKTPEQAESYLREYNYYVLQILNIHEAIPGHYAQLVYSNKAPSLIKTVFGNNAMIEGWAVYGERMMMENGYGGNLPEMQLMYDKWHLRSVCNTILDYSVHVLGWDETRAMNLLMNQAFQQEAEARGKWRRVSVTQVQLCCYFTGFTEIYELRNEIRKNPGFDLEKFHEQFLSYGSAPVKSIRRLMLSN